MRVKALILLLLLGAIGTSWGADSLQYPIVGARPLGLGGISAPLNGSRIGLFGNPAGLADLSRTGLAIDATQSAYAANVALGRFGNLAAGALDLIRSDRFWIVDGRNPLGTFLFRRNRFVVGYAVALHDELHFGATADLWRNEAGRWSRGWSLGLLMQPAPRWRLGIEGHQNPEGLWTGRAGLHFSPRSWLQLFGEVGRRRVSLGWEGRWERFSLRAGVTLRGSRLADARVRLAGGLTLRPYRGIALHYAYLASDTAPTRGVHWLSLDLPLRALIAQRAPTRRPSVGKPPRTVDYGQPVDVAASPERPEKRFTSVPEAPPESAAATPPAPTPDAADQAPAPIQPVPMVPVVGGTEERAESETAPSPPLSSPGEAIPNASRPRRSSRLLLPTRPTTPKPPRRLITRAIDPQLDIPAYVNGSPRRLIEHHAEKYGVPIPLILALIHAESNFNPRAVSPSKAVGLLQLLPAAARDMGLPLRDRDILTERDPRFDPVMNLDAGIRYLAHLLYRYDWNEALAIAAYNAGPGNVSKEIPLRRETERHVAKVMNYYYRYRSDPAAVSEAWTKLETLAHEWARR